MDVVALVAMVLDGARGDHLWLAVADAAVPPVALLLVRTEWHHEDANVGVGMARILLLCHVLLSMIC